jgi:hypothetical protein
MNGLSSNLLQAPLSARRSIAAWYSYRFEVGSFLPLVDEDDNLHFYVTWGVKAVTSPSTSLHIRQSRMGVMLHVNIVCLRKLTYENSEDVHIGESTFIVLNL